MENRGVDVLERVRDFDGFLADFIRRADDVASFHAAAGRPIQRCVGGSTGST